MAVTTPANMAGGNATTTSDQINRITKHEFVQQGIDIVHAYANDCRLSIVFPEHSPAQLAEWIWRRRADKNGTIPLLPRHITVRLPDGRLRIMDRNSENKPTYPVPDMAHDVIDTYRPVVPPDVDEGHSLPAPFLRSNDNRADDTEASFKEDYGLPANGFPLDKFPSPPPDTHSPVRNLDPSRSPESSEPGSPEIDIIYPPREGSAAGHDGNSSKKSVSSRQLEKMLEQVRNKRRRIRRMLDDSQMELAQAVSDLQKARNDVKLSVADARKTLERLKQLFGTKRTLQVLDVVQRGREGRFRSSDFITIDPPQIPSQNGSSQYDDDDESTGSQPDSWSSRANDFAINENTVVPNNVTVAVPANGAANVTNQETDEQVHEVAAVIAPQVMSVTEVPVKDSNQETGDQIRESAALHPSQTMAMTVSHLLASRSGRSSRKRTRHKNEDSEEEVERSILYDIRSGSSKKRRFNNTARSENSPRSRSKAPAGDGNIDSQRFVQGIKPGEIVKDRRPKREHAVFLSTPSPFRLRHVQDRAKFAPMIAHLGLDETERPLSPPRHLDTQTESSRPRRPLRRSASRIVPYGGGGYLYVKH